MARPFEPFLTPQIVYKLGDTKVVADAVSRHPLIEKEELHPSVPNTAWAAPAKSAEDTAASAQKIKQAKQQLIGPF